MTEEEAREFLKDSARALGAVVDPVDFAAREKELEAKRAEARKVLAGLKPPG